MPIYSTSSLSAPDILALYVSGDQKTFANIISSFTLGQALAFIEHSGAPRHVAINALKSVLLSR